jgi:predicted small lipoprotein YifL
MKKSLLIAMRGLMALMAVAPLLAGCGDKNVVAPGKNDTPEVKEQRGQKSGD